MVVAQERPTYTGTMHKTPEDAAYDLHSRQIRLRQEGRTREAEMLTIIPCDFLSTTCKKRAYKLT
jgi:hypothetical protein